MKGRDVVMQTIEDCIKRHSTKLYTPTVFTIGNQPVRDSQLLHKMYVYLSWANRQQRVRPIVWVETDDGHVLIRREYHKYCKQHEHWRQLLFHNGLSGYLYSNNTLTVYRVSASVDLMYDIPVVDLKPLPSVITPTTPITPPTNKHLLMVIPWMERGGADEYDLAVLASVREKYKNITIITTRQDTKNPLITQYQQYTNDIWTLPDGDTDPHHFLQALTDSIPVDTVWIRNSMAGYRLARQSNNTTRFIDILHMDTTTDRLGFEHTSAPFAPFLSGRVVVSHRLKAIVPGAIVIPPPVDVEFWRCESAVREKVLFVGRFVAQKRPDLFVDVCRRLPFDNVCVMVGAVGADTNHNPPSYPNYPTVYKWTDDKQSLRRHYCQAKCLVLTSDNEGVPLVALQARACGCVVVGRRVGAVAEVPGVRLCDDVDCLVARVTACLHGTDAHGIADGNSDGVYSMEMFKRDINMVF